MRGAHIPLSFIPQSEPNIMEQFVRPGPKPIPLLGRCLLALLFVVAGFSKLGTIAATSHTMASHGIRFPTIWCGVWPRSNLAEG